ncbi:MAG: helix-turn-helix domain-containing protein [Candidatus Beckwithbacteria bacterium]
MQSLGELLQSGRVKTKLTLTQLSRKTKIPVKTLINLEKNHFLKLPAPTYIQGFVKNYAQAVGLDPFKTIAVLKRDYDRHQSKKIIPKGLAQPLNQSFFHSNLGRNLLAAGAVLFTLSLYLGFTIFRLYQPPPINIFQPQEAQEGTSPVLIKGKTDRDATLTLNDKTINLEPDGSFTTIYNGPPGTHELKLKAVSRRQKQTELILYVIITQ